MKISEIYRAGLAALRPAPALKAQVGPGYVAPKPVAEEHEIQSLADWIHACRQGEIDREELDRRVDGLVAPKRPDAQQAVRLFVADVAS